MASPAQGRCAWVLRWAISSTGLYAAIGILAALNHRHVSGVGQYIDLALLDTVVGMMANQGQNYFVGGTVPTRTGAEHPNLAPYRTFATRDGHVIIAVGNDAQFRKLCEVLGVEGLASDPRFRTNADRVREPARAGRADRGEDTPHGR